MLAESMAASSTRRTSGALYPFPLKGGSTSTLANQGVKSGRDGRSLFTRLAVPTGTLSSSSTKVSSDRSGWASIVTICCSREGLPACQNSSHSQSTTCGTRSGCAEVATKLSVMSGAPFDCERQELFHIMRIYASNFLFQCSVEGHSALSSV